MAADFALIALNWLLIGAVQVPLRGLFPHVQALRLCCGRAGFSTGHCSTSRHADHSDGLCRRTRYCRQRSARSGPHSRQIHFVGRLLWLCFAYCLQGAPWTASGLFCGAGLLHFGALWAWRWQSESHDHSEPRSGEVRNVLIVGAGSVGRRVASYLEGHPTGRAVYGFLDNDRPLSNRVIGRVNDLARLARTGFVDEVILAAPHDRSLTLQVLREARRLRLDVEIVPDLFGCKPAGLEVERVGDLRMICLHAERLPVGGLALKRVVDVVGAGVGADAAVAGAGGDRGADQAGFAGRSSILRTAGGTEGATVPLLQIPHHGEQCG